MIDPEIHNGFNVILADPPWNHVTRSPKGLLGRPQHYARMKLADIKALPVVAACDKNAHLFLWTTGVHMAQAFEVMKAWGFKYSAMGFVWVKLRKTHHGESFKTADLHTGQGYTTRKNAEFVLLGRRGNSQRMSKKIHEIIIAPRRDHSRKPEEAHRRIELYAQGPRLELFARQEREGWVTLGDEVGKYPLTGEKQNFTV